MAQLAEASVVIALRDWQWMHRTARDQFPDRYLALAGNAEKKLGDAAVRHDERLFLFELKSTEKCFKDEWRKVVLDDGSTQPRKSAHRWSTDLARRLLAQTTAAATDKLLLVWSLQAHHFVYWSPMLFSGIPASGHLELQPYVLGTSRKCKDVTWQLFARRWNAAFELATVRPSLDTDPPKSIRYELEVAVPLDAIHSHRARLMELISAASQIRAWRYLGLPLREFQSYVDALCSGLNRAEPINAVVLSDGGSFFAHLTSTDQLKTIFDPPAPDELIQQRIADSSSASNLPVAAPAEAEDSGPRP